MVLFHVELPERLRSLYRLVEAAEGVSTKGLKVVQDAGQYLALNLIVPRGCALVHMSRTYLRFERNMRQQWTLEVLRTSSF